MSLFLKKMEEHSETFVHTLSVIVDSPWAAEVAQQCAEGQEAALMHFWIG